MSTTSTALVPNTSQAVSRVAAPRPTGSLPASSPAPSTPAQTPPPKPSPGTFRHPRLTEIISRQSRSTLKDSNIRSATINAAAIFLSFIFSRDIHEIGNAVLTLSSLMPPSTATSITATIIFALRLLFLLNLILCLRPILPYISNKDNISDIPLNPSQRALLGLPLSTTSTPVSTQTNPNAGTSGYITPPRYQRSFSPTSNNSTPDYGTDRRSISGNYSSSPLSTSRYTLGFSPSPSGSQQPYSRRTASGSPFNPTASPLFQKAIRHQHTSSQELLQRDFDISSRSSLGPLNQSLYNNSTTSIINTPSPLNRNLSSGLGRSQSVKERGIKRAGSPQSANANADASGTASPIAQKGVNYKWLYDKGFSGPGANGAKGRGSGMG